MNFRILAGALLGLAGFAAHGSTLFPASTPRASSASNATMSSVSSPVASVSASSWVSSSGVPVPTGTIINNTTTPIPANTVKSYGFQRVGVKARTESCDDEGQIPVFVLEDGATLKDVIIAGGPNGSDGVHCKGNCTLENVHWEDVCEDAATMYGGSGKVMKVIGGSARDASDKVFQHNGKGSTVQLEGFTTYGNIGRLWASCGNCENNGGLRKLIANNVNITGTVLKPDGTESYVLRLNYNYGDKATVRNMKIKNYSPGHPKVCVQAVGVQPGGNQTNDGEFWNTAYCDISNSNVTAY